MWADNPPAVIKVGTSLLSDERGRLTDRWIGPVVAEVGRWIDAGRRVLLVTSGAIGAGLGELGRVDPPRGLQQKQAFAAIGQGLLMHFYHDLFRPHNIRVAQVLLTREALGRRESYLNARNTLSALLAFGRVLPIINENDTVAVEELTFEQNDSLAAIVASKMGADLLVLLTDVDGLYDRAPGAPDATLIRDVREITPEIEAVAGGAASGRARGGMASKLEAARICMRAGVRMVVANGKAPERLEAVRNCGECLGTVFHPAVERLSHRKRWIAFGSEPRGTLVLDAGAVTAVTTRGKSLLPAGIREVRGAFEVGDTVLLLGPDGIEIARGLVNFSAVDVRRIMGRHTRELADVLGSVQYDEVVHRDNLVGAGDRA